METKKLREYNSSQDKHLKNYFIYFKNNKIAAQKRKVNTDRLKLPALGEKVNH